jgi:cytochrome c peroxidase
MKRIVGLALAAPVFVLAPAHAAEGTAAPAPAWTWELPGYLPVPRVPADNPMSEAKFELGRRLFYDKRLSGNGTISCASCHLQDRGFTDGRKVAVGATGETTPRNAPGLANVAWRATLTWANPALVTLERQMEAPLYGEHPVEMGVDDETKPTILARLAADPFYPRWFEAAFPGELRPVTFASIIKAIATFERGLVSAASRYDLYLQGKVKLTDSEQRGHDLFFGERGECHHCHGSPDLDDHFIHARTRQVETPFHNTGLYNVDEAGGYPAPNRGLFELTGEATDMGKFRAQSLRNVAVTAPYMHDGSAATLEEVLDIYSEGGRKIDSGPHAGDGRASPVKSDLVVRIDLTEEEKVDLLAFLRTLTDEAFLTSPRFSDPWTGTPAPSSDTIAAPR